MRISSPIAVGLAALLCGCPLISEDLANQKTALEDDTGSVESGTDAASHGCTVENDPCAETCERIYSEEGCNIQRPGASSAELTDHCLTACLDAWAVAGEVGDYDPFSLTLSSTPITLDNCAQVERWNQCVGDLSCEELEEGYCAPIW